MIALAVANVVASAAKVAVAAFPSRSPSNFVASISPSSLKITPSTSFTLKIIWLSVLNFIWSVASLPTTKDGFVIEVTVVNEASKSYSKVPFPTVTVKPSPPVGTATAGPSVPPINS